MDEYNDSCPICGGQTYLISAAISCRLPVYKDGWGLDGPVDTSEEIFQCGACNRIVPSEYVFGEMSQGQALKSMAPPLTKEEWLQAQPRFKGE